METLLRRGRVQRQSLRSRASLSTPDLPEEPGEGHPNAVTDQRNAHQQDDEDNNESYENIHESQLAQDVGRAEKVKRRPHDKKLSGIDSFWYAGASCQLVAHAQAKLYSSFVCATKKRGLDCGTRILRVFTGRTPVPLSDRTSSYHAIIFD